VGQVERKSGMEVAGQLAVETAFWFALSKVVHLPF